MKKAYYVQITFYVYDEPVALQVIAVYAESKDQAEVKGYEFAEDLVNQGTWDYGHDKIEAEVLGII